MPVSKVHLRVADPTFTQRETGCGIIGWMTDLESEMTNRIGTVRYFISLDRQEVDCKRCLKRGQRSRRIG